MYYSDFHIHSTNSFDGKNTIDDICKKAIGEGLKEICFTEHFSINPYATTYNFLNIDIYNEEIENSIYIYEGKIKIRKGLEICEPHINKEILVNTIAPMNLDFIIGSLHNINEVKFRKFIEGKTNKAAYEEYFKEVYNLALLGEMDILGHLDLLKRYAFQSLSNYSFKEFKYIISSILKVLIDRNIGIEINSSGERNEVSEFFPKIEILKLYKSLGGQIITIGSDSHDDYNIGYGFDSSYLLLKEIGFKYFYTYEKRKEIPVKIY